MRRALTALGATFLILLFAGGPFGCGNDPPAPPDRPQCSNGVDDDQDGFIDFPADPGCTSESDDDETDEVPPPTPPPTPPPDPAKQKRQVAGCCCSWLEPDNPDCERRDEGIEDGWSAMNEPAMDRFIEDLGGTMSGIIVRSSPLPDDHPTFATTQEIVGSLGAARARGLGKSLHDAWGRWPGRHGIDRCGQTAAEVRAGVMRPCTKQFGQARVAATCSADVIQSTGNELGLDSLQGLSVPEQDAFRAALRISVKATRYSPLPVSVYRLIPQRQTDLTDYERAVIGAIREVCPDAEISSNADTNVPFCSETSDPICKDFIEIHGFPTEQYWPRAVDLGPQVIWSESDNEKHSVAAWVGAVEAVENAGGVAGLWRGPHTRAEWATVLNAVADVEPPPPPPPPPPGACPTTPSQDWTCRCTDGCDDNRPPEAELYGAAVRAAIVAVVQAERKPYLNEARTKLTSPDQKGAYTADVAAELRRMGYCAWANPPWSHKPTRNLDEVGVSVGGGEFSHREQFDLVLGAGEVSVGPDNRHYAASCRPR